MDLKVIENPNHQTSVEYVKSVKFDHVMCGYSTKLGNKYIIATVKDDQIHYDILHNNNIIPTTDPRSLENAVKIYNSIVLGKIETFEYMITKKLSTLNVCPESLLKPYYDEVKSFPLQYKYSGETFILVHQEETIRIIQVVK